MRFNQRGGGIGGGEEGEVGIREEEGGTDSRKSSGGKARPVKMFADVSWERG